MKNGNRIIIFIVLCFLRFPGHPQAQTNIPSTPDDRLNRAQTLELLLKNTNDNQVARELAMIYSVIASDDFQQETVLKAESLLKQASKLFPSDAEIMAAQGSVTTMLANFSELTAKKLIYTKKGFRLMDRAIKSDPDNIGARLQRGNNSLRIPPFLQRTHYAKKDFLHILNLIDETKGPDFKAMVLFSLGQAEDILGHREAASAYWKESSQLDSAYWSKRAWEKLK